MSEKVSPEVPGGVSLTELWLREAISIDSPFVVVTKGGKPRGLEPAIAFDPERSAVAQWRTSSRATVSSFLKHYMMVVVTTASYLIIVCCLLSPVLSIQWEVVGHPCHTRGKALKLKAVVSSPRFRSESSGPIWYYRSQVRSQPWCMRINQAEASEMLSSDDYMASLGQVRQATSEKFWVVMCLRTRS